MLATTPTLLQLIQHRQQQRQATCSASASTCSAASAANKLPHSSSASSSPSPTARSSLNPVQVHERPPGDSRAQSGGARPPSHPLLAMAGFRAAAAQVLLRRLHPKLLAAEQLAGLHSCKLLLDLLLDCISCYLTDETKYQVHANPSTLRDKKYGPVDMLCKFVDRGPKLMGEAAKMVGRNSKVGGP